jgi:U3 small nucleolar RNA-associated protein MPP10
VKYLLIKLQERVEEIHSSMLKNLDSKPWQVKGEVTANARPQDSLLEEYLEFDSVSRQAPLINADSSEKLEKLIKQRIKDKAFDDVVRKIKPVEMQYEYKKQIVLDQEKSKQGLADVYEQEFLKQQQEKMAAEGGASGGEVNVDKVKNPKHDEIRKRIEGLFMKLDALSNFHFTPKAPQSELRVVSNMPAISMEEVAPVGVALSNSLAPEEIRVSAVFFFIYLIKFSLLDIFIKFAFSRRGSEVCPRASQRRTSLIKSEICATRSSSAARRLSSARRSSCSLRQ